MVKGIKQGKRMMWRRKLCLYSWQWRSQNEAEGDMAPAKQTCQVFLLVIYITFELLENKRKEQSDSRRCQ